MSHQTGKHNQLDCFASANPDGLDGVLLPAYFPSIVAAASFMAFVLSSGPNETGRWLAVWLIRSALRVPECCALSVLYAAPT